MKRLGMINGGKGHQESSCRGSDRKTTKATQNPHMIAKPDHAQMDPKTDRSRLEGIVSKRLDRPYVSGPIRDWVKVKCAAWKEENRWRAEVFEKAR